MLPYLLIDLLYIGIPVVRTDGRLIGRAVHEKLKARGDPSALSAHAWENCLAVLSQQLPKLAQWPKLCFLKFNTDTNWKIWNRQRAHNCRRQNVLGLQTKPSRRWTTLLDVLQWVQCIATEVNQFHFKWGCCFGESYCPWRNKILINSRQQ